jgi:peptidoglycan/LPS O-acetylase OafA/YrhL
MKRSSKPMFNSRLPSLDGWRAISIILVLGAHSSVAFGFPKSLDSLFNWSFDGRLGVRFFFVISGFLITWLMLVEKAKTGRVNLRHFYVRRALRILPVYAAFLATLGLIQINSSYHQNAVQWIGNLTFITDFAVAQWTNGHLWSLAVEEQFYVLWPCLFTLWLMHHNTRVSLIALLVPISAAPVFRVC